MSPETIVKFIKYLQYEHCCFRETAGVSCAICNSDVHYAYMEEEKYMFRCIKCKTIVVVNAKSPREAREKYMTLTRCKQGGAGDV